MSDVSVIIDDPIVNSSIVDNKSKDDFFDEIKDGLENDYTLIRRVLLSPDEHKDALLKMYYRWKIVTKQYQEKVDGEIDIDKIIDNLFKMKDDGVLTDDECKKELALEIIDNFDYLSGYVKFKQYYDDEKIYRRVFQATVLMEMIRMAAIVERINNIPMDQSIVKVFLDNPGQFRYGKDVYKIIGSDLRGMIYGG